MSMKLVYESNFIEGEGLSDGETRDLIEENFPEIPHNYDLFKERPSILAVAYMPGQGSFSGKVIFNNAYLWSLNGKPISVKEAKKRGYPVLGDPPDDQMLKTFNIIHVLIHELGHILGLRHDEHHDSKDVMDAFYSGKLELSLWDIYRILAKYPRRIFSRWNAYARLKKAFKRIKLRLQD